MTIFDPLRRRHVPLTPEEEVRQRFVRFLIDGKSFPAGLVSNEVSLCINGMQARADTVVYSRTGSPLMIVEYKAPSVRITQKVFDQVSRYNSVLRVGYLVVTNGQQLFCARLDYSTMTYHFLPDIPRYTDL